MDYENLTPQYRIEEYLEAIVEGWAEATQYPYPDYPSWRIEEFLDAFITYIWEDGDHPRHPCPDPVWRLEECLRAIYDVMTGAATPWAFPTPTNSIEEYLAAIHAYLADGTELPVPEPVWRIEQWLAYVLDAVKQGGDVTKTVSGTMVHITDALAKAALSVLASIEPIQDLHGYANPWPGGGGINKLGWLETGSQSVEGSGSASFTQDTSTFTIDSTLTASYGFRFRNRCKVTLAAGTYYLSSNVTGQSVGEGIFVFDTGTNSILARARSEGGSSFTLAAETTVALGLSLHYATPAGTYKFQLEAGSTVTSWQPYSNICPISGRTGLMVYRTGKNLFDPNSTGHEWVTNTNVISTVGTSKSMRISLESGETITLSNENASSSYNILLIACLGENDVVLSRNIVISGETSITKTAPTGTKCAIVSFYIWGQVSKAQLEVGSSATTYEPYNGNTYAADWTTQAGTVYGGTVDVVTGLLTVNMGNIPSYNGETINEPWLSSMDAYAAGTTPTTGAQVVYKLATPLTYQLSAQEVQMLLGENYVWSSSGDTVSVTYYAEGNANLLQSLNILLGGRYSNPKTADDVSDKEALEIILGGNK